MPKFCFVGDLHFEALEKYYPKDTNPNKFIFEQLTKVINYCRRAEITNIFQLGDVFDHPYPDQKSIKDFLAFLYEHQDLNFYIIAGNHDYSNIKTTSLEVGSFLSETKLLNNVKIFTKPQHEVVEGINVFFSPYPSYKKFDYLMDTACLCLGHFEVKGAKHDSGQLIKNGVAKEDLSANDYWVLGHLHRHQPLTPQIYYTGTMLQYNFGEPLPKGFVISNINTDDLNKALLVDHYYVELDTPYVLENMIINKQDDFNNIKCNDDKYYYKLFIEGNDIVIPQKFLNGSITNIYKIIRLQDTKTENNLVDQTLSEAFNEDTLKEQLFEPLGGLDDYLLKQGFDESELLVTKTLLNDLQLSYNPKRN